MQHNPQHHFLVDIVEAMVFQTHLTVKMREKNHMVHLYLVGPREGRMTQCTNLVGTNDGPGAGCKGAAGLKPCWSCVNVISGNRTLPPGHVHLGNADTTLLRLQTDEGLQAVVAYLRGCRNKKDLQEGEKTAGMVSVEHGKGNLGIHVLARLDIHRISICGFDASILCQRLSGTRHWPLVCAV